MIYLIELDALLVWSPLIVVAIAIAGLRFGSQLRQWALQTLYSLTGDVLAAHGTRPCSTDKALDRLVTCHLLGASVAGRATPPS